MDFRQKSPIEISSTKCNTIPNTPFATRISISHLPFSETMSSQQQKYQIFHTRIPISNIHIFTHLNQCLLLHISQTPFPIPTGLNNRLHSFLQPRQLLNLSYHLPFLRHCPLTFSSTTSSSFSFIAHSDNCDKPVLFSERMPTRQAGGHAFNDPKSSRRLSAFSTPFQLPFLHF